MVLKVRLFFDMGSDCSLINARCLNKFKLKPYNLKSPINLVGFRIDVTTRVTEAVTTTLEVDNVKLTLNLYVIEDILVDCNILIGRNFRHYLIGVPFKIITDCNAVRYSLNKQTLVPRICRWVLLTQEFNFEVLHRAGSQMQHVDALSRNPTFHCEGIEASNAVMAISESDRVQLQNPNICKIEDILQSGEADQNKRIFNEYELLGNKVYRKTEYGRRWVVTKQCIWQVIRYNHDEVGHFALDKTIDRYKVTDMRGSNRSSKPCEGIACVENIKPWI